MNAVMRDSKMHGLWFSQINIARKTFWVKQSNPNQIYLYVQKKCDKPQKNLAIRHCVTQPVGILVVKNNTNYLEIIIV